MITKKPSLSKIELTYRCNHKCNYCFHANETCTSKIKNFKEASDKAFNEILEKLVDSEFYQFNFTGGEPILFQKRLFKGIEFCAKHYIGSAMNTNGTLLNDENLKILKDLGLESMLMSFPSHEEMKFDNITGTNGNYMKALKAIDLIRKYDFTFAANMVITRDNKEDVFSTGKFLIDKFEIKTFGASPIYAVNCFQRENYSLTKDEILQIMDDLLRLKDETKIDVSMLRPMPFCIVEDHERYFPLIKACSAGTDELAIDPVGNVKVCTSYEMSFGNILKEDIDNIICRMADWRKEFHESSSIFYEGCKGCSVIDRCRSGCRVEAQTFTGDLRGRNPYMGSPMITKVFGYAPREYNLLDSSPIFIDAVIMKHGENFLINSDSKSLEVSPAELGLYFSLKEGASVRKTAIEIARKLNLDRHRVNKFVNILLSNELIKLESGGKYKCQKY